MLITRLRKHIYSWLVKSFIRTKPFFKNGRDDYLFQMSNFPQKKLKAYKETGNMGHLKEESKVGEIIPEETQVLDLQTSNNSF